MDTLWQNSGQCSLSIPPENIRKSLSCIVGEYYPKMGKTSKGQPLIAYTIVFKQAHGLTH